MYVGLLPSWGDKWNKKWGVGPEIFTPENAERYGEWIGKRYANAGVVWIMGGDRPTETDLHRAIIRAMAKGVQRGSGGKQLITFHPVGGNGSSTFFPDDPWISFHMRQNGHGTEYTGKYDQLTADYQRKPTKLCSMASRSTKTIRSRLTRRSLVTPLPLMSGERCIGIFFKELVDTPMDTIPSGSSHQTNTLRSTIR